MKKVLKWIGIVLGSLIGLVLLVAIVLFAKSRLEFSHNYQVQVKSVAVSTDAASMERGKASCDHSLHGMSSGRLGRRSAFL